jgi:hypothetical protein
VFRFAGDKLQDKKYLSSEIERMKIELEEEKKKVVFSLQRYLPLKRKAKKS